MKQILLAIPFLSAIAFYSHFCAQARAASPDESADGILQPERLDAVQRKALELFGEFSAGTSYNEIWIRDFNTFIRGALKVHPKETVRETLLMFLKIQGADGNIVDGVVPEEKATGGYDYRRSDLLPGWAAHKNTVETDQESSLLQAFAQYIEETGDTEVLDIRIADRSVIARLEDALLYVRKDRWSSKYGLVIGATTIDWGDVQPETGWGVAINEKTKWAIDIYDNAMYAMAIDAFLEIKPEDYVPREDWKSIHASLKQNVREHLWDAAAKKYIPHIYLNGTPFSEGFDENQILYSGGSICAVLADFHTREEVREIYSQLTAAAASENHATIGYTVFPPYPIEEYPNMAPYRYQNGGDWTWFGGRMTEGLLRYGFSDEAAETLKPMVERVLAHDGFYEWWDVRTGEPHGSGNFRGAAGVLFDAIDALRAHTSDVAD